MVIFYTALGVGAVWASWGTGRIGVVYLSEILAEAGWTKNQIAVVEFLLTMFLGVIFAVTFVEPETAKQALAAGMGWTSFLTRPVGSEKQRQGPGDVGE